jgi:pyridoxal 5'-phosphate synthase pdxS subunit
MATELPSNGTTVTNGNAESSFTVKTGLARMLKGGVIMDVVNAEQVRATLLGLTSQSSPNQKSSSD